MTKKIRSRVHSVSWVLLPSFLILGIVFPAAGIAALLCMSLPVVIALFRGRVWCGHYCPRGSFLDLLFSRAKGRIAPISGRRKKLSRYAVFSLLMALFAVQLYFAEGLSGAGLVFFRMVFVTTLAAFALAALFGRRSWCSVCPMGTLASLASRRTAKKKQPVLIDAGRCVSCRACDAACPMQVKPMSFRETGAVTHADCTSCLSCSAKCPKKAIA